MMDIRPTAVGAWLIVGIGVWAAAMAWLIQGSYDIAMGVALFHLIGGGGAVLTWIVARRTEGPLVVRIIVAGWCAKVLGTLARYYVLQVIYSGSGDAHLYSNTGAWVAETLRSGVLAWHRPGEQVIGTHFVEYVTGVVFAITGPTTLGGFMVFSGLGFVGMFLLFRAVRIAAPEVDGRLYALLLFFLPTMMFWPSSIGKETLMLLGIGLFTYGAALVLVRRMVGLVTLAAGVALTALVRPHLTLLLIAALLLATVVARPPGRPREVPLGKIVKVGLAAGLLLWAMTAAGDFLDVGALDNRAAVDAALAATSEQTAQGGSAFAAVNPAFYPLALVTVLFRPFPFEVSNAQALVTSFEGMFLLGLAVRRRSAIWQGIKRIRTSPMMSLALVYTGIFVYAYTGVNNFGLLARQRAQVYPFFLMLLAVAIIGPEREDPPPRTARTLVSEEV